MLPCSQLIAFTRFSENLTSDFNIEVSEIQTSPRFLGDTLPHPRVIAFTNLGIHLVCPAAPQGDVNIPSAFYS